MTSDYMEHLKTLVDQQTGREYPCSNQVVLRAIIFNGYNKDKEDWLYSHGFVPLNSQKDQMVWTRSGIPWRVFTTWEEGYCGYRFYELFLDASFDDQLVAKIITPYMVNYCHKIEFIV